MNINSVGHIKVDVDSRIPKYKQIVDSLVTSIANGDLAYGDKIPSINEVSEECLLSRDTVEKAYTILKEQRIIVSVRGKGFYVAETDIKSKRSVLFLINKLSNYKMRIYNSFVQAIGSDTKVDLDIYHCEPSVFSDILERKLKEYDHFVIMAHFKDAHRHHTGCSEEILQLIRSIPPEKLIILDRDIETLSLKTGRIFQDFKDDIYNALNTGLSKIDKYKKMVLVYPSKALYPYPKDIVVGFKKFCIHHDFDFEVLDEIYEGMELQNKDLYITIAETDLVNLVKQVRDAHLELGKDIGVISYNDTPLKELLGITVISTDFTKMGEKAARMILENKRETVLNDFNFIHRKSL
ncbi:GntR family transcriptional regulator [Allomuricauda sp. ARW1Y1]|jgi:DNA-binding transcriptional regulator YhcF (GntR family)|uniref:GntR family transcriptional regulator n=1 Tax=Allomuricauda sp. ARW1Y1 TaxID=2663843 RepID=UPI0015C8555F|nr:GntR family transcriptional regulator [Muricauda sp. ARW1Y1]NYJ27887.1 DNA-binding transcriptional regulator YhcF (GntR family) [Muricauda sp. ARW1Y1]